MGESLSGIPRILEHYDRACFRFTENFLRMVFPTVGQVTPQVTPQVTTQVTPQVTTQVTTQVYELLKVFTGEHSSQELQDKLRLANREHFRKSHLQPALNDGFIELTLPDKPNSSKQKYRLTEKGILAINSC